MHLLFRGRLKLLAASLVAVVLLTWLYLLAGNLEGEFKPRRRHRNRCRRARSDGGAAVSRWSDQSVIRRFKVNNLMEGCSSVQQGASILSRWLFF